MAKRKKKELTLEEKLEQALVPADEQPYEVPGNWVWTTLNSINHYLGKSLDPKKSPDENFELYSVPSWSNHYPEVASGANIGSTKRVVEKGDVLLCKINPRINRVWYVAKHTDLKLIASSEWIVIRNKHLNSKYLMLYLTSNYFRELMLSNVSGVGGSLMRARPKYVMTYPIPLPPLTEQQRIVDRIESLFGKLDQAKELSQNALDTFEIRKAAILHKAFTGELTAKWREKSGVGMESWVRCQLKDVCTVNPPKANFKDLADDIRVTFIPMTVVSEVTGTIVDPVSRSLGDVKKGYTSFCEGDVLFAKITPCMENGKSAVVGKLVNNIGYGSTEFYVLRCSKKLYNLYLYHLVRNQSFRSEAKSVMAGAVGQQRVPKSFLEEYSLYLPSLPEQQEIVRILDSLFEKEQKAKELYDVIEKIDLMKKSILARAFRGELGTNDPNEASALELLKECLK